MEKLLTTLLYRSNIFHLDEKDVHLQLLSHSEYSSLKAITDTLDYFKIENIAANVPIEALPQLPDSFLALIEKKKGSPELALSSKAGRIAKIKTAKRKNEKFNLGEFKKIWTGTIVAVEKVSKKTGSLHAEPKLEAVLAALLLATVIGSFILNSSGLAVMIYIILSLTGIIVSLFVNKEAMGLNDTVTARVCGLISNKSESCSIVINSNQGLYFKGFGLGDASLIYFVSLTTLVLLSGFEIGFFYIISLATLPFVFISIYLQAFRIKQWCLLCLVIAFTLVAQFVALHILFDSAGFSIAYYIQAAIIFLLTTLTWSFLKRFWKDSIKLKATLHSYYKLKRVQDFFLLALKKERYINQPDHDGVEISFGPQTAPIHIIAVTNPLCGYCKASFLTYDNLITSYPKDIKVSFVFNVPTNPENKSNRITARILELFEENKALSYRAMKEWFEERDPDDWHKKYGNPQSDRHFAEAVIDTHRTWCQDNEIHYTPLTLVNGYTFPHKHYELEDLHFFIEGLKAQFSEEEVLLST